MIYSFVLSTSTFSFHIPQLHLLLKVTECPAYNHLSKDLRCPGYRSSKVSSEGERPRVPGSECDQVWKLPVYELGAITNPLYKLTGLNNDLGECGWFRGVVIQQKMAPHTRAAWWTDMEPNLTARWVRSEIICNEVIPFTKAPLSW